MSWILPIHKKPAARRPVHVHRVWADVSMQCPTLCINEVRCDTVNIR